jgi:antitoxin component YwqK of YwqJK toxin-antitoxin module
MAGELLQDKFVKMYHSNQLAEQGTFKKGLKIGLWKTWFTNGMVETTQKWSDGLQSGFFFRYNESGLLIEKGNFKCGRKHGFWIDFVRKDTLVYKNGILFVKKIKIPKTKKLETTSEKKPEREGFFKRFFRKKQTKEKTNG